MGTLKCLPLSHVVILHVTSCSLQIWCMIQEGASKGVWATALGETFMQDLFTQHLLYTRVIPSTMNSTWFWAAFFKAEQGDKNTISIIINTLCVPRCNRLLRKPKISSQNRSKWVWGKGRMEPGHFLLKSLPEVSYTFNLSQYVVPQEDEEHTEFDGTHNDLKISLGKTWHIAHKTKQTAVLREFPTCLLCALPMLQVQFLPICWVIRAHQLARLKHYWHRVSWCCFRLMSFCINISY